MGKVVVEPGIAGYACNSTYFYHILSSNGTSLS